MKKRISRILHVGTWEEKYSEENEVHDDKR